MRYIKTIISIMIIALILTACTQENSNEGILNAVSYTHLDVYKRQAYI